MFSFGSVELVSGTLFSVFVSFLYPLVVGISMCSFGSVELVSGTLFSAFVPFSTEVSMKNVRRR